MNIFFSLLSSWQMMDRLKFICIQLVKIIPLFFNKIKNVKYSSNKIPVSMAG